ncbi:MAG: hypothetical protein HW380_2855 [Magnetococcales bacterium]|nr:hypothetical protein [Magnetococcales bacterium]
MLVVAILVVVLIAAAGISMFVNPNDYREELFRLVKQHTGRDLVIREGVELSLVPWIGIQAKGVELGNAPGFGPEPFAHVTSLDIRVRLESLLRKKLEVDTIVVKGLELNLGRNAQGVGNWEDLARKKQAPTEETAGATPQNTAQNTESEPAPAMMAAMAFQGVAVENGRIRWSDARSGNAVEVDNLGLAVGRFVQGKPVSVDLHARVMRPAPSPAGQLALKGLLTVDTEKGKINGIMETLSLTLVDPAGKTDGLNLAMAGDWSMNLGDMALALNLEKIEFHASDPALSGMVVHAGLKGQVDWNPGAQMVKVNLKQVGLEAGGSLMAGIKAHAEMDVAAQVDLATMTLVATLPGLNIEAREGALKEGFVRIETTGRVRADLHRHQVNMTMDGMSVRGEGAVFAGGGFTGRMDAEIKADMEKQIVATRLDKAILEMTGGTFRTGGGELKFRADTLLTLDTHRLEGRLDAVTFSLHGPMVNNGRVDGGVAILWNTTLSGKGPVVANLNDLTVNFGGTVVGGDFSLEGSFDLTANPGSGLYSANFASLVLETKGEMLKGGWGKVELRGQVEVDLAKKEIRTHAKQLAIHTYGGVMGKDRLQLSGPAEIHTQLDGPHIRTVLKDMTLSAQGEGYTGGVLTGTLNGSVDADMKQGTLNLAGFELKAGGARLSGNMKVAGLGIRPTWEGKWQLHEFNLASTMKKLRVDPMRTRDNKALEKVALLMTIKGGGEQLSLEGIELLLDESHVTGQVKVVKLDPMNLTFAIAIDAIDLDRYRAPEEKNQGGGKGAKAALREAQDAKKSRGEMGLPDMKGQMRVGRLKVFDLRLTDAAIHLTANKGVLGIHPMEARLYAGQLQGNAEVDFRSGKPKTSLKVALTSVQGGPLLADVTGVDRITGQANASADLSMQGFASDEIKRTLSGNTHFVFSNGAIKGVNIARLVRATQPVAKALPAEGGDLAEQTDFYDFSASVKLDDGLATNNDLSLKSSLLRVTGAGQADLPKDNLDYQIQVALVESLTGQGGKTLQELKNVTIPVRVTGSVTRPRYQVNLKGLVNEDFKEEVKQKIMDKIENKLDGGLRDKLKEKGLDGILEQVVPKGLDKLFKKF